MTKKIKTSLVFIITILFTILSFYLCYKLTEPEFFAYFKSIFQPNFKGYLTYFVIVVLQIIFLPISTMFLIVPALIMFGPWNTFFVTLLALCVGAILTYLVGLICRKPIKRWIAKYPTINAWCVQLEKNGKIFLPYFSIVPIIPDELICLLSGITKINFWYFCIVTIISRAVSLISVCFMGAIIPMHGWWLVLWAVIFVVMTILCYIATKKQEKIKQWFIKTFSKKKI